MPSENTLFVESLVSVNDQESYDVATNIVEILDGESLENLQEIEELLKYYLKAKANEDTIHRSLSSILYKK